MRELDLLRFLAAFSVVVFHYSTFGCRVGFSAFYAFLDSIAKYGYLGVELFFMISGFVILMSARGRGLFEFIISRVSRLYPAFWVCCTATFVFVLFTEGHAEVIASKEGVNFYQYLMNLTMIGRWFGAVSIDGVYWTLYQEVKFYLLVGLVLLLKNFSYIEALMLRVKRFPWIEMLLLIWLISCVILDLSTSENIVFRLLRFALIAKNATFFIAGATYYLIWLKGFNWIRIILLCITLGFAIFQKIAQIENLKAWGHEGHSEFIIAGIVISFFLIFLLISLRKTGALSSRDWIFWGSLTYPLYLIHHRIGGILIRDFSSYVNEYLLFFGLISLMFFFAYLIHVLFEKHGTLWLKKLLQANFARLQPPKEKKDKLRP
ncbi:MAG: acyltransferase [Pirellulaceae bacterium]|nr:acyltransferase [Pirellulaceae bacterium]